jgi:uncharacterized membrane protein
MTRLSPDAKETALRDPLRSSGGLHEAGRFRRGVAEFLRIPFVLTAGFCLAAAGVAVLDGLGGTGPVGRLAGMVVDGGNASNFLSAVATSLLTVTSITFSVLLVAVQQTASSLTSVVFDQFLRRRANQVYFGFFVGVTAFCFVVLGLARTKPAPVLGALAALVLTIAALVVLLLLIHSTIDQMRPQSVVRSIHELALRARERELGLLGGTRAERRSPEDAPARAVPVLDSGYVVSIDFERLARVARDAGGDEGEVLVEARLGEYVIFGDPVARVVGADPEDDRYDREVLLSFGFDDIRDVRLESGYSIDQLENIAWSTSTSAGQSPNTATAAIRALRDLVGRWLVAGERDRSDRADRPETLPVVYIDGAVERVFDALATLVVGSAESRQAQTTAELLFGFAGLLPRLESRGDHEIFDRALDPVLGSVIQQAEVPRLRDALTALGKAMDDAGHDAARVREVQRLLREATVRLLPKASDEPEAAHPR